jgi:hypothetical protein
MRSLHQVKKTIHELVLIGLRLQKKHAWEMIAAWLAYGKIKSKQILNCVLRIKAVRLFICVVKGSGVYLYIYSIL